MLTMKKNMPLRCPCDEKTRLRSVPGGLICNNPECSHGREAGAFKIIEAVPILISETKTDTVCTSEPQRHYVERSSGLLSKIKKWATRPNQETLMNCRKFLACLSDRSDKPKVLIIGGGEQGSGTKELWSSEKIEIHSADIYSSDTVDLICDGHYLPLANESYDGVWIQAVLEHVVEPQRVALEISRVLRTGGIVYAETPFLQQVHEGRYDFTRFTVLGHRFLFKDFEAMDLGPLGNPISPLIWSTRYLLWGILRSRLLAAIFSRILELFLSPIGALVSKDSKYDSSSGVFFMGRKTGGPSITHAELVKGYRGMQV